MSSTSISPASFNSFFFWKHRTTIRKFPASEQSSLYDVWLRAQTAAYRSQLWAAERVFVEAHTQRLALAEQVFNDATEGWEDTPAGGRRYGFETDSGRDWSWKPHRDRVLGDKFRTFYGVAPSAAELSRK